MSSTQCGVCGVQGTLDGESRCPRHSRMDRAPSEIVRRFEVAAAAGKIQELLSVWSPQDTLADTRYQYVDLHGNSHILFHREVDRFLTGLEAS